MSDDNTTPTPTPDPAPVAGQETFSKDYVQQLRNEAAKYRTEKNDAVEAAKAAVQQEWEGKLTETASKISELEGQLGAAGIELTKLRIALELGVPSDKVLAFAEILKGDNEDAIKASATSAKELFGGFAAPPSNDPAFDPTQGSGRGGGALPLNGDPILAALKKAVGA